MRSGTTPARSLRAAAERVPTKNIRSVVAEKVPKTLPRYWTSTLCCSRVCWLAIQPSAGTPSVL
jgi:hypothetical protein